MEEGQRARSIWSLHIGTVLGIPIRLHFTFLFLLVWFGFFSARSGDPPVLSVVFLVLVFACVALHELGHAAMARRFGVRTREIVLYPIGGVARLENIPSGRAELLVALAGPAVNLVLAALLLILALLLAAPVGLAGTSTALTVGQLVNRLLLANVLLFAFNLLPAFPMDGGRVLRAALSFRMSESQATEIAALIGQGMAIVFAAIGLLSRGGSMLVFIALFVFIGASQEAFLHRQLAAVRGRLAREAMITRFETLAPHDSLARAAENLVATHQQDFPVVDAWNRVVGVLQRAALLQGLAERGPQAAALEVMDREFQTAGPTDDLDRVLRRMREKPTSPVIVVEGDRMLGMITPENLSEFIEITRRQ